MGDQELRAAVIGASGFIGRVHARASRLAGGRQIAVGASDPQRAAQAAAELGAERTIATPEALAADDGIDVVHICTPNHLHVDYAAAALRSGKHVICEKPLALDHAGAGELAALAASTGLVATVPFVYRFYPTVREARARVRSGGAGAVRLIHGSYLQDWMSRPEDYSWRVAPELGGRSRALADIGSHWCDLAEFVTGHRITRLVASLRTALPERRQAASRAAFSSDGPAGETAPVLTEDLATLMFETDGGAAGSMLVSQISPGRKNRLWLEIDAAESSLVFDQEAPEQLWLGAREQATVLMRDGENLGEQAQRLVTLPGGHPQGYHDCFDAFVADTYAAIRGAPVPDGLPGFEDGLRAAALVDAALESSDKASWVEVPS